MRSRGVAPSGLDRGGEVVEGAAAVGDQFPQDLVHRGGAGADRHRAVPVLRRGPGGAVRGLRSRPTWRILLYSNEPTPMKRGFVMVDGVDARIVSSFVEDNPEDWTDLQS